jgi:hypothetical protein
VGAGDAGRRDGRGDRETGEGDGGGSGDDPGWAIQFEDEVSFGGKGTHTIEVEGDVKKFGKLENKKVTMKGTIVHRSGAEGKDWMVFVVEKIKEWKAPAAERPSSY